MKDPTNDLNPDEKRVEELLLRSAKLDVPHKLTKQRALDAGLATLGERPWRRPVMIAAGTVLGLAASSVLWVKSDPVPTLPASREVIPVPAPSKAVVPDLRPECPKLVTARGDAPLFEDWEENDSRVAPLDGRGGYWATYDDGTGKQTPPDKSPLFPTRITSGRGASTRALHMVGGKFKDWGVTFGAELASAACYDASAYAGVQFWAKGPGVIKVGLQMIDVQDVKYGGLCKTAADCYNTHRKIIELSKTWKQYSVRWEDLHQLYEAGPPLAFDPRRVRFLEFGIGPENTPYDLWIDDVAFVKR